MIEQKKKSRNIRLNMWKNKSNKSKNIKKTRRSLYYNYW